MAFFNRGAHRLRELLKEPNTILSIPGVYDGLTARMAIAQGFDCLYMTGAGTSMSRLGMADLGLATQNDMIANASMIASLDPSIPVIADADTGYGGPIMVKKTVEAYARGGVAGLHIEDQVQEKRCGHLLGKQIVERDVFYSRLRAATAARDAMGSEIVIIARTDARAVEGFDEAVERLKGALKCGVDVLFFEALKSEDEARKVCDIFQGTPMLLNMVPGGSTPNISAEQAKELGFRLIIFPGACLEATISKGMEELQALKTTGRMADGGNVRKGFELCGLHELMKTDKMAGGQAYQKV